MFFYYTVVLVLFVRLNVFQQMDVKMHLDVQPQHLQQEQMLDDDDEVRNSSRPRRKSSFRRMYEACDRMVQLYFAEGDGKFTIFKTFYCLAWRKICFKLCCECSTF